MKRRALAAVEKAEPKDVAVQKIRKSPQAARQTRIDLFLQPTLHPGLLAAGKIGHGLVRDEPVFEVEKINHFAACIGIVLVRPPAERVEVVIKDLTVKPGGGALNEDMLVHPTFFATAFADAK